MADYKNLTVYKKAFEQAMRVFELTKQFPEEEKWSLTSQIRRSSRSVCSNLGEGYRKRMYENHFISKISDSDMENTETQVWFDFALACNYINTETHNELNSMSDEIGRLLNHRFKILKNILAATQISLLRKKMLKHKF